MNYGLLVLGATIQISLFLHLCSVSAEMIAFSSPHRLPYVGPQMDLEFQEAINFSPTVFSWLTGRNTYVMEKLMWEAFAPTTPEEAEAIQVFLEGWENQRFRIMGADGVESDSKEIHDIPVAIPESTEPRGGIGDFCKSFGASRQEFLAVKHARKLKSESQGPIMQARTTEGEEPEAPEGCYYYRGHTVYKTFLVCSNSSIQQVPQLPPVLDFFEMNSTGVVRIEGGTFEKIVLKGMRLNNNNITEVHPHAFDGVEKLTHVEISYNRLCWIWFEFILGLDETLTLLLENNDIFLDRPELVMMDRRPIEDYEPTLKSLNLLSLMGNPLNVIPKMFFASLRLSPIRLLKLQKCQLYYIHPESLIHLKDLQILDLSQNPLLMPNLTIALSGLRSPKLIQLVLAQNSLHEVPKSALDLVKSTLQELDMRGNNLFNSLGRESFPEMPALKELNLAACQISTIGITAFDRLPNLVTIILKDNLLRVVPPTLSYLYKLNTLDLSGQDTRNSIGNEQRFQILPNTFANQRSLRILILDNVPLEVMDKSALKGLTSLLMLEMQNTRLGALEDFTFDELKTLRTLDLRLNPLGTISSNAFYGLGNLENLYLEFCELIIPTDERLRADDEKSPSYKPVPSNFIDTLGGKLVVQKPVIDFATVGQAINSIASSDENIPIGSRSEPFKYLIRLKFLYLKNNLIRELKPNLFQSMKYLLSLDLSNNFVELWKERLFENNTALQQLNLSNNQIMSVTDAMIVDFQDILLNPKLDISGNSFLCDVGTCKLVTEVNNSTIVLEHWKIFDKYTCRYPPNWDKVQLSSLDEAFCSEATNVPTVAPTTTTIELPTTPTTTTITTTTTTTEPAKTSTTTETPTTPIENKDGGNTEDPTTGPTSIVTVVIIVSCVLVTICVGAFFYTRRMDIKHFWFITKFNIKRSPRKGRGSDLISESHDYDVFISYSHHDAEFVQDFLVPELEGHGKLMDGSQNDEKEHSLVVDMESEVAKDEDWFKVCLHERDFEVGTPIMENIIECVDKSRKVIVLVSKNYLESQWCLFEMNLAYHRLVEARRDSFLVIVLEEVPPEHRTKVLNYLMKSRTYLQWPGKGASANELKIFWNRLRNSVGSDD